MEDLSLIKAQVQNKPVKPGKLRALRPTKKKALVTLGGGGLIAATIYHPALLGTYVSVGLTIATTLFTLVLSHPILSIIFVAGAYGFRRVRRWYKRL